MSDQDVLRRLPGTFFLKDKVIWGQRRSYQAGWKFVFTLQTWPAQVLKSHSFMVHQRLLDVSNSWYVCRDVFVFGHQLFQHFRNGLATISCTPVAEANHQPCGRWCCCHPWCSHVTMSPVMWQVGAPTSCSRMLVGWNPSTWVGFHHRDCSVLIVLPCSASICWVVDLVMKGRAGEMVNWC